MNQILNAERFLSEIRKLNFSGRDFLEIIGNSKIDNSVYNEIKESRGLTFERLVELLSNSPLTHEDYTRLLRDAQALLRINAQGRRQNSEVKLENAIKEAEKRLAVKERLEREEQSRRAKQLIAEARQKAAEELSREESETQEFTAEPNPLLQEVSKTQELTNKLKISTQRASTPRVTYVPPDYDDDDNDKDEEDFIHANAANFQAHHDSERVSVSASDNKGKLILISIMSLVLIIASFTVRYFMTGSFFLEKEIPLVLTVPETYEELSLRLSGAGGTASEVFPAAGNYRFSDDELLPLPATFLNNERYIFNLTGNKLYVVEVRSGSAVKAAEIEHRDETIREIYLVGERLYVISDGEYSGSYRHVEESGSEYEDIPLIIADNFIQSTVTVRVYDALEFTGFPLTQFTVDGEYGGVIFNRGRFMLATHYTPHDPSAHSDLAAFVPSYTLGSERQFIGINNIYAPPAALMNTRMTVISELNGNDVNIHAVVGGAGSLYVGESLFVTQSFEGGEHSRLIKYELSGVTEPVYFDVAGIIPLGAVHEGVGIVRVGVYGAEDAALYVMNSELELISRVTNIGSEQDVPRSVFFDRGRAYFAGDKLYVFDTSQPGDILPVGEPFPRIYSDDFYRISDTERLEVLIEADPDGNRAGIRLNVHSQDSITATHLITADSTVAGNWNPFLFTDAETSRDAVFISEQRGIIIIPVKYFNSISHIEKVIVFDYNQYAGLVRRYEIVFFDINKERRRAALIDGFVYSFWDTTVVSANENDGSVFMTLELD
jgi:hypothetical protein